MGHFRCDLGREVFPRGVSTRTRSMVAATSPGRSYTALGDMREVAFGERRPRWVRRISVSVGTR